jgi:hypothetical protein
MSNSDVVRSPRGMLTTLMVVGIFLTQGCYPFGSSLGDFHLKPSEHCYSQPLNLRPVALDETSIFHHAIFVNGEGKALDPHIGRCATNFADSAAYGRYITTILDSVRAVPNRKVLLRIHGGLNTLNGSFESTVGMTRQIEADPTTNFYPVFVNWESGLMSAYGEHAFLLFRGSRPTGFPGFVRKTLGSPFFIAADIGTGLIRYPITQGTQLLDIDRSWNRNNMPELVPPTQITAGKSIGNEAAQADTTGVSSGRMVRLAVPESALFAAYLNGIRRSTAGQSSTHEPHDDAIALSRFGYHRSLFGMLVEVIPGVLLSTIPTRYLVEKRSRSTKPFSYSWSKHSWHRAAQVISWLPPKAITLSLVSGLGTPAWESMHRRTDLMIRPTSNYVQPPGRSAAFAHPGGALAQLLDSLSQLDTTHSITVVGHSMGAIVASQILRYDKLPIDNIVFLASAASMRETNESVTPFLQSHKKTEFYSVTLHPLAEQRESHLFSLTPHGSLLAWIDAYFGHIETPADRMSGVYSDLINANGMFPDSVRGRVHFKAFGYGSGTGCGDSKNLPYRHGDFNDPAVPYWHQAFWAPSPKPCAEVFVPRVLAGKK